MAVPKCIFFFKFLWVSKLSINPTPPIALRQWLRRQKKITTFVAALRERITRPCLSYPTIVFRRQVAVYPEGFHGRREDERHRIFGLSFTCRRRKRASESAGASAIPLILCEQHGCIITYRTSPLP